MDDACDEMLLVDDSQPTTMAKDSKCKGYRNMYKIINNYIYICRLECIQLEENLQRCRLHPLTYGKDKEKHEKHVSQI